jgi:pyruvate dehydrogenase E2 component (dihydrolipoamide acetyltransferase)
MPGNAERLAMDYEMKMPDLSTTEDEVKIIEWYVEIGEKVTRGDPLLSVETDKATMDVESVVTGALKQIIVGDDLQAGAGQVIAIIEVPDRPGDNA